MFSYKNQFVLLLVPKKPQIKKKLLQIFTAFSLSAEHSYKLKKAGILRTDQVHE